MLLKDMDSVTIPLRQGLNNHYAEMRKVLQDENSTHEELEMVLNKLISIANLFKSEIHDLKLYENDPSM